MTGSGEFGFVQLDSSFPDVAGMDFGNGDDLKGLFAGHLFHHPIGRAALADADFFDLQPFGLVDDPVQDQFGSGGIAHKGAEIDRFEKAQGPVFAGGIEDRRGRDDGMRPGQGHIEQVGAFHVDRDGRAPGFAAPFFDHFLFEPLDPVRKPSLKRSMDLPFSMEVSASMVRISGSALAPISRSLAMDMSIWVSIPKGQ